MEKGLWRESFWTVPASLGSPKGLAASFEFVSVHVTAPLKLEEHGRFICFMWFSVQYQSPELSDVDIKSSGSLAENQPILKFQFEYIRRMQKRKDKVPGTRHNHRASQGITGHWTMTQLEFQASLAARRACRTRSLPWSAFHPSMRQM